MRPTVKDVARHAGVSPKTVSNVLGTGVPVRSETRARVEAAVQALGYVPNLAARGLRGGRTGLIAIAVPDLGTPYSAEMTHHFVALAHERGYGVQFDETLLAPPRVWSLVAQARARLIDGAVLNPATFEESVIPEASSLPPIVVTGEVEQDLADHVWVDPVAAASDMVAHLLTTGRRRIAVLGVPDEAFTTETARLRLLGVHRALRAAGLVPDPALEVALPGWSPGAAAEGMRGLLLRGTPFDAVFCFTDSLAVGALHVLWHAGMRVPEDVAIAGFDDIAEAAYTVPPLTTVAFDKRAFARHALDLLVARIREPGEAPRRIAVPHCIVVRRSTAGG